MKKILSFVLAISIILGIFSGLEITANALDSGGSCGTSVYYTFNSSTGLLTISGNGEMENYDYYLTNRSPFYSQTSIKNIIINSGVTSIGLYAFYNCSGLTSVTIGKSVKRIESAAFDGCIGLSNIIVTSGNNVFDSRNGCNAVIESATNTLFLGCKNTVIPDTVTSIGDCAFSVCTGLTSITIPDSVTSIDAYAFDGCSGLTSITIGNGLTSIGLGAFRNCRKLSSIAIPDSVTFIDDAAFYDCRGLKELIMPCSAKTTNSELTFYNCAQIEKITLTKGTGKMQDFSNPILFNNAITDYSSTPWYKSGYYLKELVLEDGITYIGKGAFYSNRITNITIPASVKGIGSYAFVYCSNLANIIVDSGNTAFDSRNDCNAIIETSTNTLIAGCKNTAIPNSVTSIGDRAFYGFSGLKSITIPNSVTNIDDKAFYGCSGLTSITIPSSVKSIGNNAFCGCSGLTSITIPDSVTSIGGYVFDGCSGLTSITIGKGLTSIGLGAFENCRKITKITIPNSITSIEGDAFSGCTSLTSITIPDSVTNINNHTFYGCSGLTSITIPDSVTSIGNYAFYECIGLTDVYYSGTEDDWNNISIDSGNSALTNATIHYNYLPAHEHSYTSAVTTAPTCGKSGVKTYTCSVCGDTYTKTIAATGEHTYTGIITTAATCTKAGVKTYTCSICGDTYTETIAATGEHTYTSSVTTAATCTKAGVRTYTCSVCGAKNTEEIAALGHNMKLIEAVESSGTQTGHNAYYHCTRCDKYFKDVNGTTETTLEYEYIEHGFLPVNSDSVSVNLAEHEIHQFDIENPGEYEITISGENECDASLFYIKGNGSEYIDRRYGNDITLIFSAKEDMFDVGVWLELEGEGNVEVTCRTIKAPTSIKYTPVQEYVLLQEAGSGWYNTTPYDDEQGNLNSVDTSYYYNLENYSSGGFASGDKLTLEYEDGTSVTYTFAENHGWQDDDENIFTGYLEMKDNQNSKPWTVGSDNYFWFEFLGVKSNLIPVTILENKELDSNYKYNDGVIVRYTGSDTEVTVPATLGNHKIFEIDSYAFALNKDIISVTLPDSVCDIYGDAFRNCTNLENIYFSYDLEYIGGDAFSGCDNLKDVYFYGTEDDWNNIEISEGNESLQNATVHFLFNNENLCGGHINYAFDETTGILTLTGRGTTYDYSSGEDIFSPFYNNDKIKKVIVSEGVDYIGQDLFYGCSNLKEISLPSTLCELGQGCFWGCSSLESITIPYSVTFIGYYAFTDCTALKDIYYAGSESDWNEIEIGEENENLLNANIHFDFEQTHKHEYVSTVTTPATCTKDGVKTYTCSVCGDTYTETIAATGKHTYTSSVTTAATCTKAGVRTYTCSVCGAKNTEEIAALGHNMKLIEAVESSGTQTGHNAYYHCTRCDKYFKDVNGTTETTPEAEIIEIQITLTKIEIHSLPNKTDYFVGESFTSDGLKIKATYSDGTSSVLDTGFNCSAVDTSSAGQKTVTVTYEGKTAIFNINIKKVMTENDGAMVVSRVTARPGNNVDVTVELTQNPGIISMKLKVNYDESVMTLKTVTDAGILGSATHSNKYSSPYTLTWANDTATENITATGVIVTLSFEVKQGALEGEYPVSVTYNTTTDDDIINFDLDSVDFDITNGTVTVKNYIVGDVNGDGSVTTKDRIVLSRYLADWEGYGEDVIDVNAADVNGDGSVTTKDRIILSRHLADWAGYETLPYAG